MKNFNIYNDLPEELSEEEIIAYLKKFHKGDKEAKNQIIIHNLRLVKYESLKFVNYDFDDIFQHGVIGLIKSIDTFNLSRKSKFKNYASRYIEKEIIIFINKQKEYKNNISLDQIIEKYKGKAEFKLKETLDNINFDFVSECENNESYRVIREVINQLPEKEKIIVIKYFGFVDNKPISQIKIANELGIAQSTVSKIIKRVVREISIKLTLLGIIETSRKNENITSKKVMTKKMTNSSIL